MSIKELIAPGLAKDDQLADRVRQATRVLRDVVGESGVEIQAFWQSDKDALGRPIVRLELSDFTGRVENQFAPDELAATPHLRRRLHWIWGDLLQERARRQINDALVLAGEEGGPS